MLTFKSENCLSIVLIYTFHDILKQNRPFAYLWHAKVVCAFNENTNQILYGYFSGNNQVLSQSIWYFLMSFRLD